MLIKLSENGALRFVSITNKINYNEITDSCTRRTVYYFKKKKALK